MRPMCCSFVQASSCWNFRWGICKMVTLWLHSHWKVSCQWSRKKENCTHPERNTPIRAWRVFQGAPCSLRQSLFHGKMATGATWQLTWQPSCRPCGVCAWLFRRLHLSAAGWNPVRILRCCQSVLTCHHTLHLTASVALWMMRRTALTRHGLINGSRWS